MKPLLLLLITALFCQMATAQELKTAKRAGIGFKEEYSVLASDKKVKHGDYKRYSPKNQLIIEGKYDNNQKTDEWKFYSDGELEQVYDYSIKQLKFAKPVTTPFITEQNGIQQEQLLDTPPMYLGSKSRLNEELNKVMQYPEQARRMGVDGLVTASVWIDTNNGISAKIIKDLHSGCDSELLKGLSQIDPDWVAGTLNGVPIKAQYILVFEYKLGPEGSSMSVK
jgi:hypothetical protein